jgi:hypothetical protein
LGAAGGSFKDGEKVVVVINNVGSADGGCAGIVSGDVVHSGGVDRLVGVSSWGAVCVTASAVEERVV